MPKKIVWSWEKLDENTYRAKVIGGWILALTPFTPSTNKNSPSHSATFIADRDHEWMPIQPVTNEQKPPVSKLAEGFATQPSKA